MAQEHVEGDERHAASAEGSEAELIAGRRGDKVADEEWRGQEGTAVTIREETIRFSKKGGELSLAA